MKYNQINQPVYAEADDAYAGEGLSARLDAFIKGNNISDTGDIPPAPPAPIVVDDSPPPPADPPVEPPAPKADDPPPADPPAEDEEEEELPGLGAAKKPASTDLDFDAQTDAIVKAIEAKGHPGDEYKRLRAQLKSLKDVKPMADLDKIPEVQTLKQQAAEAERFKAEAEALRQRNKELLQVNNEVEVRESDEFIAAVRKPIESMEKVVAQIATGAELDAASLFAVITEQDITKQDRMLESLHQKLGSRTAGRIERFCDDYKAIEAKGADMLAEAGKNAERARLARDQAAREEGVRRVELFKSSVENSFTSYAKRIPGFTDSSGNLTDIAQAAMAKTAEVALDQLGPDDLGYMAFAANALPEARKAIVKLQKEIALLKGSKPDTKPLGGNTAPPREKEDDYMGLSERMKGLEFTFTPPS